MATKGLFTFNILEIKMSETGTVDLYLKSGNVIRAKYDNDEYFEIYDNWFSGKNMVLNFLNCSVRSEDVSAIEWESVPTFDVIEEE